MKIEISSTEVKVKKGTGKKSLKPYEIHEQEAYVYLVGKKFPHPFTLTLRDGAQPYPVGLYELDVASALYVGDFGQLTLGRFELKAIKA